MNATPHADPQAAVRAAIHRRCADAHLHDIRGSLQALFGALELLCRVAKSGGDPARAEKACELARRAVGHHETTTLELFRLLTCQSDGIRVHDLRSLVDEVAHLFRNDVAARGLSLQVTGNARPEVKAERGALHAAVAALLSVAIDSSASGSQLRVQVAGGPGGGLTLQFTPAGPGSVPDASAPAPAAAPPADWLLEATAQCLTDLGGRLDIATDADANRRCLLVTLPSA